MTWALDLGTTNSAVARWDDSRARPALVELPAVCRRPDRDDPLEAPRLVPSSVHLLERSGLLDRVGAWVLELAKVGYSDIRKAVRWGEEIAIKDAEGNEAISNGVAMLDSAEIDDDTAAAIAEVAQTRDGIKIKFHDKLGALEKIGKHLGMFVDRHEHSGKDGGPIETVELSPLEAARRLAFAWQKGIRAMEEKSE